ncbi:MAG: ankyrin repeat domain-containing protein [Myxococcota bacterium]|nr:ankyrin repeat domain-containing protein [Myxococcota bacterium]
MRRSNPPTLVQLACEGSRFAGTGEVYDGFPLVAARRATSLPRLPSQADWYPQPYELAADLRIVAETDWLITPTPWVIVRQEAARALGAFGVAPRETPVVLVDYDLGLRRRRAGTRRRTDFVAVDVHDLSDRIDLSRTRAALRSLVFLPVPQDAVLRADYDELPALFGLRVTNHWFAPASAMEHFESMRGVKVVKRLGSHPHVGLTPLMRQIIDAHEATVLDVSRERLEETDAFGFTALFHAVEASHDAALRRLLEAGANLEARNLRGMTPLMLAAYLGDRHAAMQHLIAGGARLDAADEHGWTAAHWAAWAGDLVGWTLVSGATDPGEAAFTPLEIAASRDAPELVAAILDSGPQGEAELSRAFERCLKRRSTEAALLLLRAGARVDPERHAETLHIAAHSLDTQLLDAVLDLGLEVDVISGRGTALGWVADVPSDRAREIGPMVRHLLSLGADPTLAPASGRSAIEAAQRALEDARRDPHAREEDALALEEILETLKTGGKHL